MGPIVGCCHCKLPLDQHADRRCLYASKLYEVRARYWRCGQSSHGTIHWLGTLYSGLITSFGVACGHCGDVFYVFVPGQFENHTGPVDLTSDQRFVLSCEHCHTPNHFAGRPL